MPLAKVRVPSSEFRVQSAAAAGGAASAQHAGSPLGPRASGLGPRTLWRLLLVVAFGLLLAGCQRPDSSYQTSPSLKALIGTTVGNVAFNPPEAPPELKDPPPRWQVELGLARWTKLENESPSMEVVLEMQTRPGAGMELWLTNEAGTVARWSAGATGTYSGVVCFQLALDDSELGEAMSLPPGEYFATVAFRDPGTGVVAARRIAVTNFVPELKGVPPGPGSEVFRDGLACRRGQ